MVLNQNYSQVYYLLLVKNEVKYLLPAAVMKLVDVVDSKSTGSDTVPVRVRPAAPYLKQTLKLDLGVFT